MKNFVGETKSTSLGPNTFYVLLHRVHMYLRCDFLWLAFDDMCIVLKGEKKAPAIHTTNVICEIFATYGTSFPLCILPLVLISDVENSLLLGINDSVIKMVFLLAFKALPFTE